MKTVAVVQARTGSTRLPGKVLLDLSGSPMLVRQLERLRLCNRLDEVVVATSNLSTDDPIEAVARTHGYPCVRGSEHDVLGRYVQAATQRNADVIVRITADCPLIDPVITDAVVAQLLDGPPCDYASNVLHRTYPRGLDAEAMHRDVVHRLDRLATSKRHREHVTLLVRDRPDLFVCSSARDTHDNSDLRWTVDTAADYAMIKRLFSELNLSRQHVPYAAVLAYVRAHPALAAMNCAIQQNTV